VRVADVVKVTVTVAAAVTFAIEEADAVVVSQTQAFTYPSNINCTRYIDLRVKNVNKGTLHQRQCIHVPRF